MLPAAAAELSKHLCSIKLGHKSRQVGEYLSELQGQQAEVDQLLPDLLLFPAGSDLHDHPLVANGSLVLQVWLLAM